ncbi:hydantoinase/oxoprolinase family protein [Schaalia naturae]|uniref:Hydantoinase/oxoprolinase family protein n=1 Tax=Schaalia naturae TaxID=635203 RepID=A0ABW2SQR0_9ACTO
MKVRIGIDVGGTFTDAVALDDTTFELVDSVKVPTTHTAAEGVAAGIVIALHQLMEKASIAPDDVVFIAHGTTQATNALLEGDVAPVGIVTLGSGLEGMKARSDSQMGDIELAPGKYLRTTNRYIDLSSEGDLSQAIDQAITELCDQGTARTVVAAEAFSVDDTANETLVVDRAREHGVPATASNEISKLYGLKIRTRTAVVNASILPKMLETADMTERSIERVGIGSQLMVMRCDGGVMTVDEVRHRPILTILSGPAAGVAGALMYERVTDGLFFEVGGTSTDISCIKDGKVMVTYAQVGGHRTYLNSLDVRTVGVGGGSMIEMSAGRPVAVGPRSAHIAGLDYEVYTDPLRNPELITVQPMDGDPSYAAVRSADGVTRALTLSGAANIAGYVRPEDYASGSAEAARIAWAPLAAAMGMSVEDAARAVLDLAARKNSAVAEALLADHRMDPRTTVFIGGGGGASTVVPHLAATMGHSHRLARNAAVISPIGVALAMVRDSVERTIVNPSPDDIVQVRNEAWTRAENSGASPDTIEVSVEVDTQRNLVRAIAIGTTEMRTKDRSQAALPDDEILRACAENLDIPVSDVRETARSAGLRVVRGTVTKKSIFGLFKTSSNPIRVADDHGVIRLQKAGGQVVQTTGREWQKDVRTLVEDMTEYNDGGVTLPNTYVLARSRVVDLSGLQDLDQLVGLAAIELSSVAPDEQLAVIATGHAD